MCKSGNCQRGSLLDTAKVWAILCAFLPDAYDVHAGMVYTSQYNLDVRQDLYSWQFQNLQISIPVTVIIGILLLIVLFSIYRGRQLIDHSKFQPSDLILGLRRCCGGTRARSAEPALEKARPQRLSSWSPVPIDTNQPPLMIRQSNLNNFRQTFLPPPVLRPGTR